uniref:Uncharacterized protein n=1 Tax=Anguilla anguilla TaxID=7936 RepID=A0A0E9RCS5_ANGAN
MRKNFFHSSSHCVEQLARSCSGGRNSGVFSKTRLHMVLDTSL